MSAWDVVAVAAGLAAVAAVAVVLARLLVAMTSLDRTTRELVRAIDDVRRQTVPRTNGAVAAGLDGSAERALDAAPTDGRGDGHGRLRPLDLGLASPVIKARALGRGTSEAARQLRQRREA